MLMIQNIQSIFKMAIVETELDKAYDIASSAWLDSNEYAGGTGERPKFGLSPIGQGIVMQKIWCYSQFKYLGGERLNNLPLPSFKQQVIHPGGYFLKAYFNGLGHETDPIITVDNKYVVIDNSDGKVYLLSSNTFYTDQNGYYDGGAPEVWIYSLMELYTGELYNMDGTGFRTTTNIIVTEGIPDIPFSTSTLGPYFLFGSVDEDTYTFAGIYPTINVMDGKYTPIPNCRFRGINAQAVWMNTGGLLIVQSGVDPSGVSIYTGHITLDLVNLIYMEVSSGVLTGKLSGPLFNVYSTVKQTFLVHDDYNRLNFAYMPIDNSPQGPPFVPAVVSVPQDYPTLVAPLARNTVSRVYCESRSIATNVRDFSIILFSSEIAYSFSGDDNFPNWNLSKLYVSKNGRIIYQQIQSPPNSGLSKWKVYSNDWINTELNGAEGNISGLIPGEDPRFNGPNMNNFTGTLVSSSFPYAEYSITNGSAPVDGNNRPLYNNIRFRSIDISTTVPLTYEGELWKQRISLEIIDDRIFPMPNMLYRDTSGTPVLLVADSERRFIIQSSGDLFDGFLKLDTGDSVEIVRGYVLHAPDDIFPVMYLIENEEGKIRLFDNFLVNGRNWASNYISNPADLKRYLPIAKKAFINPFNIYGKRLYKPDGSLYNGVARPIQTLGYYQVSDGIPKLIPGQIYSFIPDPEFFQDSPVSDIIFSTTFTKSTIKRDPFDANLLISKVGTTFPTPSNFSGDIGLGVDERSPNFRSIMLGTSAYYDWWVTGWLEEPGGVKGLRIQNGEILIEGAVSYTVSSISNFTLHGQNYDVPNTSTNYPGGIQFDDSVEYTNAIAYIAINDDSFARRMANNLYQWTHAPFVYEYTCATWLAAKYDLIDKFYNRPDAYISFGKVTSNIPTNVFLMPSNFTIFRIFNLDVDVITTGNAQLNIRLLSNTNIVNEQLFMKLDKNQNLVIENDLEKYDITYATETLDRIKKILPSAIVPASVESDL